MKKLVYSVQSLFIIMLVSIGVNAQEMIELQTSKSTVSGTKGAVATSVCKVKVRQIGNACEVVVTNDVVSPRDAASGLPTGKRQHKPIRIVKEIDKSSPLLMKSSGGGSGKVSMQDLHITYTSNGRTQKINVVNNEFTLPTDGRDNDCDLVLSWSWGTSNSGITERCELPLKLTMQDGACVAVKEIAGSTSNRN